jgi:hypothetical protein
MPDADEPVPSVRGDKPVPRPLGPIDSYHLKPCGKAPCYCARCKGRHVRRMDIVQEHITKWPSKVGPIQHHSSLLVHCLLSLKNTHAFWECIVKPPLCPAHSFVFCLSWKENSVTCVSIVKVPRSMCGSKSHHELDFSHLIKELGSDILVCLPPLHPCMPYHIFSVLIATCPLCIGFWHIVICWFPTTASLSWMLGSMCVHSALWCFCWSWKR